MQHTGFSADGKTCRIRRATADETDQITRLIMSSSIHAKALNRKLEAGPQEAQKERQGIRHVFFKIFFFLFASRVQWRNYSVAVSPEGTVIGCCQVKPQPCGIREIDTLCVDKAWRNGTVAARLMKFVIADNPYPLWGTCLDNVVAFQKRNGGIQETNPKRMPPFLRRRQRLFNFFLRLTGKKSYLAVMTLANSSRPPRQGTDASALGPNYRLNTMRTALLRRIKKYQLRKSRPFRFPGLYETVQGLFVSYPTYTSSLLQKYFKKSFLFRVPDNNAFVTFWTLDLLLEACEDTTGDLSEIRIKDAIRALMGFHDQTREQDDPLFVFWKQRRVGRHPVVFPSNLMAFYRPFRLFEALLNKSAKTLSKIRPPKNRSGGHPGHTPKRSAAAFSLPADFDDAALNWSLGSCLSDFKHTYPDAWSVWSQNSFDFKKLAQHALACAYRPFTDDPAANAIDPRSFFVISTFLWELRDTGTNIRNFSLLTTWASTVSSNLEGIHRYYKMPFNINNLDCSVQANFIHAACRAAQRNMFPHDVEHFDDLITNTAQYLAWAVASSTIINKPDLALLYYPTPTCAFFFISRIVQLLENNHRQATEGDVCTRVRNVLVPAARQHITGYLQSCAVQTDTTAFWQRLSGEQGTSPGSALDDRKFMTAASINCLLNLWTLRRGSAVEWLPSVPAPIPPLITKGLAWLRQHGLSRSCSDHNAFFSASVKHRHSLPFLFPANRVQHSEGPALSSAAQKNHGTMRHSIYAMSGVPTREEYARMLEKKSLEAVEEDTFQKCFDLDYPYWSAPTVTSALVLLALSKAEKLGL